MAQKILIFCLPILLMSCAGGGNFSAHDPSLQQPRTPYPIDIHWQAPPVPFMVLGQVKGSASINTSDETMIVALQNEAEKLHAHAIVIPQDGIQIANTPRGPQKNAHAWAIYYVRRDDENVTDIPADVITQENEEDLMKQRAKIYQEMLEQNMQLPSNQTILNPEQDLQTY